MDFIDKRSLFCLVILLLIGVTPLFSQTIGEDEYYKKALKGDAEAMHVIGSMYRDENKLDSALFWYTKSANKGYMFAQSALGELYETQEEPDYKKAFFWYEKAAKQGYNWAQFKVGHYYHYGIGVEANDKLASQWLKKSAEQGGCFGLPQYEYGSSYAETDEDKMWLLKSYKAGYKEALTEIGKYYMWGRFEQNPDSTFHYFELAALEGSANGLWHLSNCYAKGTGCAQSYKKALELYRQAEENGSNDLEMYESFQNNVTNNSPLEYDSIANGLTFKKDAAFYWYQDVAFNDNAESKYWLAFCYLNGLYGVSMDMEEALYWLMDAAESDLLEAQVILAQIYENNNDVENARYWYNQGVESEKYIVTVTSNEDYQKLKEQCKSSLERLK